MSTILNLVIFKYIILSILCLHLMDTQIHLIGIKLNDRGPWSYMDQDSSTTNVNAQLNGYKMNVCNQCQEFQKKKFNEHVSVISDVVIPSCIGNNFHVFICNKTYGEAKSHSKI